VFIWSYIRKCFYVKVSMDPTDKARTTVDKCHCTK
jgi:hypothetical protein